MDQEESYYDAIGYGQIVMSYSFSSKSATFISPFLFSWSENLKCNLCFSCMERNTFWSTFKYISSYSIYIF